MLDQLRAADGGNQEFRFVVVGALAVVNRAGEFALQNWPIDFAKLFGSCRIFDADHEAMGMEKVFDRRAFPQKFRIRSDAKATVAPAVRGEYPLQLDSSTGGHGAFFHNQFG